MTGYITPFKKEHTGLAFKFKVNPDSCGNHSHYENYLKFSALTDKKIGMGTTHIFLDEDNNQKAKAIIGFITLKASSLIKIYDDYNEGNAAMEITELAVDINYEKQGFGTKLVNYAITIADMLNNDYIGISYITTCADPLAVSFYEHYGFAKCSDYYEVPREGWNAGCTPMYLKLPEN